MKLIRVLEDISVSAENIYGYYGCCSYFGDSLGMCLLGYTTKLITL